MKKQKPIEGIRVPFNPKNTYGEPCCCERGCLTKFTASTFFCRVCNLFCCRRLFKTSSWCKKFGWDKTCTTCQQKGLYNQPEDGKTSLYTDEQIEQLVKISEEIRELCINEYQNEFFTSHHLPLKDNAKHALDPDNWDLSEDQLNKVKQGLKQLAKYAEYIIRRYNSYWAESPNGTVFTEELLPRWVVFPLYSRSTIGWRMGPGADYADLMISYADSLTDEERKKYIAKYPVPDYWRVISDLDFPF